VEAASIDHPVDYRRIARRVRCRLGNDPIGKQRALAALARQADRSRRMSAPEPPIHAKSSESESDVRAFARAVTSAMEGPILRFSRREELIRQAQNLGIRRFDANLLIAAVQHRLRGDLNCGTPVIESSRLRFALPICLALAVQAVILAGAWQLIHS
jgi:hypothetical protein